MNKRFSLVFHPLAEREYLDSVVWYEESLTGLGSRFVREIESALNTIEKNPFAFQIKKLNFREAVVKHFPFVIVYRINAKKKEVYVLSVFHTSRNPQEKIRK